jgi:hypothetical protein
MEDGARKQGAKYWLEKTPAHTLHAKFLAAEFPDARFFAVVRNYRDVVASNVHGFRNPQSALSWLRESVMTAVYEKVITQNEITIIRYEALQTDYERTIQVLLEKLGVHGRPVPQSRFDRNTSYTDIRPENTWWQIAAMTIGRWFILPLPSSIVEKAVIHWRGHRTGTLPPWFFARPGQPGERASQDTPE